MSEVYSVAFNISQTYGYISYNQNTKKITVTYPDEKICKLILDWLSKEHIINTPNDSDILYDFSPKKYLAANSKQELQTVLTRIWEELDVHIDWSFPTEEI